MRKGKLQPRKGENQWWKERALPEKNIEMRSLNQNPRVTEDEAILAPFGRGDAHLAFVCVHERDQHPQGERVAQHVWVTMDVYPKALTPVVRC